MDGQGGALAVIYGLDGEILSAAHAVATGPNLGERGAHVPIDRALIDTALLDAGERAWLDAYHAGIVQRIGPQLDGEARRWLEAACAPLPA